MMRRMRPPARGSSLIAASAPILRPRSSSR